MYKRDEFSCHRYTTAGVELRKWTSVRPGLLAVPLPEAITLVIEKAPYGMALH